jgi:glycosyltransferase involved in cell wall biosynthesis
VPDLISVIVTTYNREDALDAVLSALSRQSDRGFEVVIADDGSRPMTAAVVERWRTRLDVPLSHVWHLNCGFRAAEIRNRAILACRGDYCIFLDGDCIVPPDFVATHRKLAEPGWFVTGNRVLLSAALTAAVLREHLQPEAWSASAWIGQRLRGARSCNLAVWRSDLERVDGFDACFTGWGREDSDLLIRLLRCGLRRKDGRFATGVIHLWHAQLDRAQLGANDARLDGVLQSDRRRAQRGLSALRETADVGGNHRQNDRHVRAQS